MREFPDVSWGQREALLGIGVLVGISAASFGASFLISLPSGDTASVLIILLSTSALQATLLLTALRLGPGSFARAQELVGLRRLGVLRLAGWAIATFIAFVLLGLVYVSVMEQLYPDLVPTSVPDEMTGPDVRVLSFVIVVLAAPIVEEIFFRGFLFRGLLATRGLWPAALISAALFAATHLDPSLFGPAFIAGMLFALVYWRTGSVWPTILAHTAQNAIAFALGVFDLA